MKDLYDFFKIGGFIEEWNKVIVALRSLRQLLQQFYGLIILHGMQDFNNLVPFSLFGQSCDEDSVTLECYGELF